MLLLQAGGRRVVFTGDSTGGGEAAAGASLARGPPVDVLKVSHHGSRSSTTASFVREARPRVAVISVGPNSYGHPTNETVQRLRGGGARVFSTQKSGSITLTVTSRGALRWSFSRSSAPLVRGVSGAVGVGRVVEHRRLGWRLGRRRHRRRRIQRVRRLAGCSSPRRASAITAAGCRYLSHSRIAMTLSHAKADGYRPCSVCDPPALTDRRGCSRRGAPAPLAPTQPPAQVEATMRRLKAAVPAAPISLSHSGIHIS